MELSITRQGVRGGGEVLMVRDGRRLVMGFPLNMRSLAESMVDDALKIDANDAADLIALVQKYSKLKLDSVDSEVDAPPPARSNGHRVTATVSLSDRAVEFTAPIVAAEDKPFEADEPTQMITLAELLDCARQAEFQMDAAATDLERATNTFAEAERRADLAWRAFNEALHASLPTGTRIRGIQSDE